MTHPSPTASPTASDDEYEDGKQDGLTEVEVKGEAQWDVMNCVGGLMEVTTQSGGRDNLDMWNLVKQIKVITQLYRNTNHQSICYRKTSVAIKFTSN